jgi:DNA-directed RNA polymerase subunit N (RpoN/RPB10)
MLPSGFQQEITSGSKVTKIGREEMRRRDYCLFAEALLECWVNGGEESFVGCFCEWAWTAICDSKPESRSSRFEWPYKVDEVELFLEEFLGGKEFDLSIDVVVGGFCGNKLIAPVFESFTEKVAAEQDPDLDLEKLTRLDRFLKHLLFCEDPKGWKEDLTYPEWMSADHFDWSRDKRQGKLLKEFGKAYEEFQKAVEQTKIMKEVEEEGKRHRENFFKRAPKGGK